MPPEIYSKLAQDCRSKLITIQMQLDPTLVQTRINTHAHPSGIVTTVSSGAFDFVGNERKKVLHGSRYMRLLAPPASRGSLTALFGGASLDPREKSLTCSRQ